MRSTIICAFFALHYFCQAERLLVVVSGNDAANSDVEVLDVESTRLVCDKPADIPIKVFNHVAATVQGKLTVCGGFDGGQNAPSNRCFQLETSNEWTEIAAMNEARDDAVGTLIGKGLLVTSGRDGAAYEPDSYHKSSELLQDDGQWSLGSSEVPMPLSNACMVHLNGTHTLLLGGHDNNYNKLDTVYSYNNDRWTQLTPSMPAKRKDFMCGRLSDTEVIVAGGYYYLGTSDILDTVSMVWRTGPTLPSGWQEGQMVTINGKPTIVGGQSNANHAQESRLIQLQGNSWVELPQRLTTGRFGHSATMVESSALPGCRR